MVCFAKKNGSNWRWLMATAETCSWKKQRKNTLLIKNIKGVVFDSILPIYFMVNTTDITIIPKYICSISARKVW